MKSYEYLYNLLSDGGIPINFYCPPADNNFFIEKPNRNLYDSGYRKLVFENMFHLYLKTGL